MVDSTNRPELLSYEFGVKSDDAIKAATHFQKELSKRLKLVEKSEALVNKGITKYLIKMGTAKRTFGPVLEKQVKLYDATTKAIERSRKKIERYQAVVAQNETLIKQQKASQASMDKEALAGLQKRIAKTEALKDKLKGLEEEKSGQHEALRKISSTGHEAKQALAPDRHALAESFTAAGEDLLRPFQMFASHDFIGAFKEGASTAGKILQNSLAVAKMDQSKNPGMGGMLKAMNGLLKGVAPLLESLTKMLPMLGMMGSAIFGIVKFLMDGEAAMKDFNKQVLETTGTADFLARGFGDVEKSANLAKSSMIAVYKEAASYENLQRGITKDMVAAYRSQMGAEGVNTTMLDALVNKIPSSVKQTTDAMSDFNDMMFTSVAYSRQFGVSLSEITQFQGEVFSEVGSSAAEVRAQFENMQLGAEDAGMAAGKFFGIVRSFSADLSLFSLRMEELTQVVAKLGKVMNPRAAQQFTQTLTSHFRNMDLMGRTRAVLLGGKKEVGGIMQGEVNRKTANIGRELALDPATMKRLQDTMKTGNTKSMGKLLGELGDKITSDQRSALLDATITQGNLNTGNTIDLASAIRNASPMGQKKILDQIALKRFGKPIAQLHGTDLIAIQSLADLSDEQVDGFRKMEAATELTKSDLATRLANGEKLSREQVMMLDKLHISYKAGAKDAAAADKIQKLSGDTIEDSMDQDQKNLLEASNTSERFQAQTVAMTRSANDYLAQLFDFVTTRLFTVIQDMAVWVGKLAARFGGAGGTKSEAISMALEKSKNQELLQIWAKSGNDVVKYQKNAVKEIFRPALHEGLKGKSDQDTKRFVEYLRLQVQSGKESAANADIAGKKQKLGRDLTPEELSATLMNYIDPEQLGSMLNRKIWGVTLKTGAAAAETGQVAAPTGPAAAAASSANPPAVEVKDGPTAVQQEAAVKQTATTNRLIKKGVPLNQDTVKQVGDGTLDAIRTGLFEYYMYKDLSPGMVSTGLQAGMINPATFGKGIVSGTQQTGSTSAALTSMVSANAAGGMVSGISNGMANITRFPPAPSGEGWASVGRGESIVPAGGRGGGGGVKVELELKGDFKRWINARVVDGAAEFEKNKRLR